MNREAAKYATRESLAVLGIVAGVLVGVTLLMLAVKFAPVLVFVLAVFGLVAFMWHDFYSQRKDEL